MVLALLVVAGCTDRSAGGCEGCGVGPSTWGEITWGEADGPAPLIEVVRRYTNQLRWCYGRLPPPPPSGSMRFELGFDGDSHPMRVDAAGLDPALEACAEDRMRRWVALPPVEGTLRWEMRFAPPGGSP